MCWDGDLLQWHVGTREEHASRVREEKTGLQVSVLGVEGGCEVVLKGFQRMNKDFSRKRKE